MTSDLFDVLCRSLATSRTRRGALSGAATALGVGWFAALGPGRADARKKKRKKRNKPRKNAFGCLDVGKKCNGKDRKCCSGVCKGKRPRKGKRDKSKCIAHNVVTCLATDDSCLEDSIPCGTGTFSRCFRTTGKASFCGELVGGACTPCAKDTDCEPTFGPGAACVVCPNCGVLGETACFPPGI